VATKPTAKISWTDSNPSPGDVRAEPTSGKKLTGWTADERPPMEYMNWLFWNIFEWLEYFEEVTDDYLNTLQIFDAIVGSSAPATHSTLQAAHDDAGIGPGAIILVLESAALDATVNITKANIEIWFKPGVTYSKNTANTGINVGASADGVRIKYGRFAGFTTAAIDVAAGADYVYLLNQRFSGNTKDVEDNSNPTIVIQNPITE